jgi:hypothetical protein
MEEIDYSIETEEEFLEDFGAAGLSDKELNNVLIKARKNSNIELRLIVKELQYARYLLKHIIEFVEEDTSEFLTIQKLVKSYVDATVRANNKNFIKRQL